MSRSINPEMAEQSRQGLFCIEILLNYTKKQGLLYNTQSLIPLFTLDLERAHNALSFLLGMPPSNLVATYKALGGGWQLREGNNFVSPDVIDTMKIRTDWGDLLLTPEQAENSN